MVIVYTGHEHLGSFGIINMYGRIYDPNTASFFSPDPFVVSATSTQAFNRYSYCLNNPLMYTDPSGEFPWLIPVIAGALIGTYSGGIMANDGQYNPLKWNFSSSKTWGYMFGGAIVGGLSGYGGWAIAGSGIPMANTAAIAGASLTNSIGTYIYTGGQTDITMSLGFGSYNFTKNKFSTFSSKNKWYQNLGYALGTLGNVSDIMTLPFLGGQNVEVITNNEDWISHSEVAVDGKSVISWGPTKTSYSNWEYLTSVNPGTNSYHSYYNEINKTLPHLAIKANANIINAYANFLNNTQLPYNAIFSSCSTQASIALNLAGAFNLGFLHPYLLHYQLMLMPSIYINSSQLQYLGNFRR